MRFYSPFWLAFAARIITLGPIWAQRDREAEMISASCVPDVDPDTLVHPAETLDMHAWLRLSNREHAAVIVAYAPNRKSDPLRLKG